MAEREIMTVAELSEYLRVHPSTIYRFLRQKKIPAFRMGSDWRFTRSEIDKWCAAKSVSDAAEGVRRQSWKHGRTSARKKAGA